MLTLNQKIKELSKVIENIKEIETSEGQTKFNLYVDRYILDCFEEALEHLILKRDIKNIAEIKTEKLIENYDKAKKYDYSYKNTEHFFMCGETGLTESLLKHAPTELVERFKIHFNEHLRFRELYAFEKAIDSLAKKIQKEQSFLLIIVMREIYRKGGNYYCQYILKKALKKQNQ